MMGVKGSIVNISSGASRKMRRSVVPYCVSKTALDRLNKGLAIELAEFGIRVNIVEPGLAPRQRGQPSHSGTHRQRAGQYPARPSLAADRCCERCALLASDAAAYITGATLADDGGELRSARLPSINPRRSRCKVLKGSPYDIVMRSSLAAAFPRPGGAGSGLCEWPDGKKSAVLLSVDADAIPLPFYGSSEMVCPIAFRDWKSAASAYARA